MAPTPIPTPPARVDLLDGNFSAFDWGIIAACAFMVLVFILFAFAVVQVRRRHRPESKAERVHRLGTGKLEERYAKELGVLPTPATMGLVNEEPAGFKWPRLWRRGKAKKAELVAAQVDQTVDEVLAKIWAGFHTDGLPIITSNETKEPARA